MVGGLHESIDGPSAELLPNGLDLSGQTLGLDPGRGGLGLVLGDKQLSAGDVRLLAGQLGLLVADLLLLAAALVNAILMPVSLNLTDLGL